jgi:hypothetical protein
MMKCGKPGCDATWDDSETPLFNVNKTGRVESTHQQKICKNQHLNQWHRQQISGNFGPPIECKPSCSKKEPDAFAPLEY